MLKKSPILFALAVFVVAVGWPITPVQAHCKEGTPHFGDHPHCTAEETTYKVTMTDDLVFGEESYVGTDGGGKSKPVHVNFQDAIIDLSFFFDKFGENQVGEQRGEACFAAAPVVGMNTIAITILQEKDGTATLHYWFTSYGDDFDAEDGTGTEIDYLLELFDGTFVGAPWRPDEFADQETTAIFEKWDMSMNSGKNKIACTETGPEPLEDFHVEVTVLNTTKTDP